MMAMTLQDMVAEVRAELAEKLRVRGRSLEVQIRKARRHLPRYVRKEAAYLAKVLALTRNPKLARTIDHRRAQAAHDTILRYLRSVDFAQARRTALLNFLASLAFGLLSTLVLVVFLLWARGLI